MSQHDRSNPKFHAIAEKTDAEHVKFKSDAFLCIFHSSMLRRTERRLKSLRCQNIVLMLSCEDDETRVEVQNYQCDVRSKTCSVMKSCHNNITSVHVKISRRELTVGCRNSILHSDRQVMM